MVIGVTIGNTEKTTDFIETHNYTIKLHVFYNKRSDILYKNTMGVKKVVRPRKKRLG